jgi:hypothetical protein
MRQTRLTQFAAGILMISLVLFGCKKNLSDMTDGMMFSLDMNSFLQNQVQVQIVNANYENSATIPNAKISIIGKDAEKVVDINGSKNIIVEDQFANLAVSPGRPLSEGNPARFTIKAEAPGFLDYEKELVVNNVDSFLNYTLEMIEIANPPAGIDISIQQINLTGDQPAVAIPSKSKDIQASLIVPANAKLMDEVGNKFTGSADIRIDQFDVAFEPVKANISNLITNFTHNTYKNGVAEDFNFSPLGYLRVNINNNSGRKLQFDRAAQMEVALSKQITDPISGEPLQAGDILMVYQKDPANMGWSFVEQTKLTTNASGNLKANFRFVGSDEIALARTRDQVDIASRTRNCTNNLGIRFKRNSNVNTLHYIAVVNAARPTQVYLSASNVIVANNSTYNFSGALPQNVNVKVLVYQYESATDKGIVVGETGSISSCLYSTTNRLEVNVNPPSYTNNPIARFQLYTVCLESKLAYFHEGRVQFRPAGSRAPYRDMGLAQKTGNNQIEITPGRIRGDEVPGSNNYSYLETDRMVNNTTYQFKTEIIGKRQKDGKTVRKTYTRNRIFNITEFSFVPIANQTTPLKYDHYKMNRSYWIAPEDACEDFGY